MKHYKIYHINNSVFAEDEIIEGNSKREVMTLYLRKKGIKQKFIRRGNNDVEFKVYEVGFQNGEWLQKAWKKVSWYGRK